MRKTENIICNFCNIPVIFNTEGYNLAAPGLTSFMFEMTFSRSLSSGTRNNDGVSSFISAIGPCLISAALKPSACIYEISFSFKAPSSATG